MWLWIGLSVDILLEDTPINSVHPVKILIEFVWASLLIAETVWIHMYFNAKVSIDNINNKQLTKKQMVGNCSKDKRHFSYLRDSYLPGIFTFWTKTFQNLFTNFLVTQFPVFMPLFLFQQNDISVRNEKRNNSVQFLEPQRFSTSRCRKEYLSSVQVEFGENWVVA